MFRGYNKKQEIIMNSVSVKESVKELKLIINTDMFVIPPFIDVAKDKLLFESMCSILAIFKKLVTDTFLSLDEIDWQLCVIGSYESEIVEQGDKTTRLCAFLYLSNLLEGYIRYAEDYEMYETLKALEELKTIGY